jgi:serine/threonine protein kinase
MAPPQRHSRGSNNPFKNGGGAGSDIKKGHKKGIRHGPLLSARIKWANFLSRHTALDNVCAFMFRTKLRTLLLSILAMTMVLNLSRSSSKGGGMDGLLLKGTSGTGMAPGTISVPTSGAADGQAGNITSLVNEKEVRKIYTSLRRAYESPKQETPEHDSKSEDRKNNNNVDGDEDEDRRIIPKKPKRGQTSKGWDMALHPENKPSTSKVDPSSARARRGGVVVLPTTTRMIGAFATTKEASGGMYPTNSQLHYFPAHLEVYKSWREVELSDDEYENWKNPKKSRFYRSNGADEMVEGCDSMYEWQEHSFPTCNSLHEAGLADLMMDGVPRQLRPKEGAATATGLASSDDVDDPEPRVRMVNNGYWRDVWLVEEWTEDSGSAERVVKTIRYQHDFVQRNYERHRRDSVAMERLTGSPYVVDIYGFCANSGLFEFSQGGDIMNAVLPRKKDNPRAGYKPKRTKEDGELTSLEKLTLASQVSLGIKDLHNYIEEGRPSIAHTDITPTQFVEVGGFYKLNDFNRARFLAVNTETKETCPYEVGNNPGTFRAPEEYKYDPQTEKVDVYSMGNIFYFILSMKWPFEDMKSDDGQKRIIDGERPELPSAVRKSHDPAIMAIVEAIQGCWIQDPKERATAADVSNALVAQLRQEDGFREEFLKPQPTPATQTTSNDISKTSR